MIYSAETQLDIALWIALALGLVIGLIIFIIAGIYKVKKDHVIIIEKIEEYYATKGAGVYFFLPVKYRRVGYYKITQQERVILLGNQKRIVLTYQIIDPKKYHYSKQRVEKYVEKIRLNNSTISEELLISELDKIGIKFISVR